MSGQVWGISAALHEATALDQRHARYYNDDPAEYLIPVNADIGEVTTIMVSEGDSEVNELGIKDLGELGNVGLNAAVANAVCHATGVRVRNLPIRLGHLLGAPALQTLWRQQAAAGVIPSGTLRLPRSGNGRMGLG